MRREHTVVPNQRVARRRNEGRQTRQQFDRCHDSMAAPAARVLGTIANWPLRKTWRRSVEAGKKAAQAVLDVQAKVVGVLKKELGRELSLDEIAAGAGDADRTTVFCVLRHLSANPERGILRRIPDGKSVLDAVYVLK